MCSMVRRFGLVCVLGLALLTGAQAGGEKRSAGHDGDKDHVLVRADDIKWGQAPPALPSGAKLAVLTGDPSKSGLYVIRVQLPDGYKVPPHWHPTDENVTVIKGIFNIGRGDKFEASKTEALPDGSCTRMPKEKRHFAWPKGETILQLTGLAASER